MAETDFAALAASADASLDALALAFAAELRAADRAGALAELDRLAGELAPLGDPEQEAAAVGELLGGREGFCGDREEYDHPDNSMLDRVLERRRGLPILLSTVYVEVARRAGIRLAPVGLPGHFVVAHVGADPPIVLDPFSGGRVVTTEVHGELVRPWSPHETVLRMLNNLVRSYTVRGDVGRAIRAAELRLLLPSQAQTRRVLAAELRGLRAALN